jgi:hypothetical protein
MVCKKGLTKDTCPYNPALGCDCGLNEAWTKEKLSKFIEEKAKEQVRKEDIQTDKEEEASG